MNGQDPLLEELRRVSKILTLAHGKAIERELSKVATSDKRKMMWVLLDGERTPKDIAQEIRVTVRSANRFLAIAAVAGLVHNPRGKPPRRLIDYVPPSWVELVGVRGQDDEKS